MTDEIPPLKDSDISQEQPVEPQANDESAQLDDPLTSRAVDEIVAREGDELLAVQDSQQAAGVVERPGGFWRRLGRGICSKWFRGIVLCVMFGGVTTAAVVPAARYFVLNTYGAKVSASATITDDITHQPLKNVTVSVGAFHVKTNVDGHAELHGLRLGPAQLSVSRPGFGMLTRQVTLGWGGNPFGTITLKAVGMRYTLMLRDYLTAKGIAGAQVSSGDATAVSDASGKAVLTLPGTIEADINVDITADGYRPQTVTAPSAEKPLPVNLVTARRVIYASHERGTYDVYAIDADGQNKQLLLGGTGLETSNISLAVSPDGTQAAIVSIRDNQRDNTGSLMAALTLIDTHSGDTVTISHATQIRLLDWSGTRLVFEQTATDTGSAVSHVVISYDYAASSRLQLATAPHFDSLLTAQNTLYYALPADPENTTVQAGYYRIGFDGTNRQVVLQKDVWAGYRTDYNKISLQTSDGWYSSNMDTSKNTLAGPPGFFASRIYAENPEDSALSVWGDVQNGQGVLLTHNRQTGKDSIVQKQAGLTYPLRWLTGDSVVYRVTSASETADYVIGTLGNSTPHKIADVTNAYGLTAGQ